MEPKLVIYQEIPYEVSESGNIVFTPCPYNETKCSKICVGSVNCSDCKFNNGTDTKNHIVKCTHKVEE